MRGLGAGGLAGRLGSTSWVSLIAVLALLRHRWQATARLFVGDGWRPSARPRASTASRGAPAAARAARDCERQQGRGSTGARPRLGRRPGPPRLGASSRRPVPRRRASTQSQDGRAPPLARPRRARGPRSGAVGPTGRILTAPVGPGPGDDSPGLPCARPGTARRGAAARSTALLGTTALLVQRRPLDVGAACPDHSPITPGSRPDPATIRPQPSAGCGDVPAHAALAARVGERPLPAHGSGSRPGAVRPEHMEDRRVRPSGGGGGDHRAPPGRVDGRHRSGRRLIGGDAGHGTGRP